MYVGAKAREVGHHPDIDIRWQRIRFILTTHIATAPDKPRTEHRRSTLVRPSAQEWADYELRSHSVLIVWLTSAEAISTTFARVIWPRISMVVPENHDDGGRAFSLLPYAGHPVACVPRTFGGRSRQFTRIATPHRCC
jgi:Pterin 4 alpha carbinolamine dehydratase